MKNELKNKIRRAFSEETPDFREDIVTACEQEVQLPPKTEVKTTKAPVFFRRVAVALSCVILFAVGVFVGYIIPETEPPVSAETYVYLDVNPSLVLSLDESNYVISCTAANNDAEIILNGMKLEGVELKTALNAIVGSMYVKGYLNTEDNSMLISVDTNDTNHTAAFLSYITKQVNEVFTDSEMECSIIAQGVTVDEDLRRRAEEHGVSVGKMHLVDKMIVEMKDLTQEDISQLTEMSIKELNLIYSTKPENENNASGDELISGNVGGFIDKETAFNAVLTEMQTDAAGVERYNVFLLPSRHGTIRVVYVIVVKLYGDDTVYRYEVDCQTGEVSGSETQGAPPNETPPMNGESPADNSDNPPYENPGQNPERDPRVEPNG